MINKEEIESREQLTNLLKKAININDNLIYLKLDKTACKTLYDYINELKDKNQCKFIRQNDDWIVYKCSNCKENWVLECGTPEENSYNYCPNCGAKIIEVIELEEENNE